MDIPELEMYVQPARKSLDFHINIGSETALNQIGIVVLITIKFDGELFGIKRYWRDEGLIFGNVLIEFEDLSVMQNAATHYRNNTDPSGAVLQSYLGALPRADPGGREAKALLADIQAAELSN